jgi:hypothetical protein
MSAEAIFGVTQALRERLELALGASAVPGTVFVGPLDDPDANNAKLILFLYRVVPNASLRNQDHRVASGDPAAPVRVYRNALPLDLYYLVTVGTMAGASEETLLRALGSAMQSLHETPELLPKRAPGEPVTHETVRVSLEPLTTEEASRIWALFPTANYRTSIAYLATPVWIDPRQPERVGPPVVDDRLDRTMGRTDQPGAAT